MTSGATRTVRGVSFAPPAQHGLIADRELDARRWTLVERRDAVRVTLRGAVGPAEVAALDERFARLAPRHTPVIVDLTDATELHQDCIDWLGESLSRPNGVF